MSISLSPSYCTACGAKMTGLACHSPTCPKSATKCMRQTCINAAAKDNHGMCHTCLPPFESYPKFSDETETAQAMTTGVFTMKALPNTVYHHLDALQYDGDGETVVPITSGNVATKLIGRVHCPEVGQTWTLATNPTIAVRVFGSDDSVASAP